AGALPRPLGPFRAARLGAVGAAVAVVGDDGLALATLVAAFLHDAAPLRRSCNAHAAAGRPPTTRAPRAPCRKALAAAQTAERRGRSREKVAPRGGRSGRSRVSRLSELARVVRERRAHDPLG